MALIRRADADAIARDAMVVDLGDLMRQGERIRERAKAEAEQIVAAARAEREKILKGAREQGYAEGFAKGRVEGEAKGREEAMAQSIAERKTALASIERNWAQALEEWGTRREAMLQDARREVITLSLEIARRVVRREVDADRAVAERQLAGVLELLAFPTRLVVRINPRDREVLQRALPGLLKRFPLAQHAELVDDASVEPGGCLARTAGGGWIDARVRTMIDRVCEAVAPRMADFAPDTQAVEPGSPGSGAEAGPG
jgi:flagellar biosynthesis/type III secretory pathway protein FliH